MAADGRRPKICSGCGTAARIKTKIHKNKDLSAPHESNSEEDTSDWRRRQALLGCDSSNETRPQR
jgi:hypothetical protein